MFGVIFANLWDGQQTELPMTRLFYSIVQKTALIYSHNVFVRKPDLNLWHTMQVI